MERLYLTIVNYNVTMISFLIGALRKCHLFYSNKSENPLCSSYEQGRNNDHVLETEVYNNINKS